MEHVTIKIQTGNAAFADTPASELARILRDLADKLEFDGIPPQYLRDRDGKICGEVRIVADEPKFDVIDTRTGHVALRASPQHIALQAAQMFGVGRRPNPFRVHPTGSYKHGETPEGEQS